MSKKQKYENYVNSLSEKEAKKELLELLIKYDTLGAKLNKLSAHVEKNNKDTFDSTSESLPKITKKEEKIQRTDRINDGVKRKRGRKKDTLNNTTIIKEKILESNNESGTINGIDYKVVELEQDDTCPVCGEKMICIGEEPVLKYNYVPSKVEIIVYKKKKYACKNKKCQGRDILYEPNTGFAFNRISFTTSFVVYLIMQKFLLGTPIYRLKEIFEYKNIDIKYNSILNYIINAGKKINGLIELMTEKQFSDETTIKYVDETTMSLTNPGFLENGKKRKKSYVYCSVDEYRTVYKFTNSRSSEWLYTLIDKMTGVLFIVTDDYSGYNNLPLETHQNCMCHVRRRFVKAYYEAPKEVRDTLDSSARYCISLIDELFLIEREIKNYSIKEKYKVRNSERTKSIISKLKDYLEKINPPQGSYMEDAKKYALSNWDNLWTYLKDGRVSISNQIAENKIKKACMIRNNSIIFNNQETAIANFNLLSLVQTAKMHNLNIEAYLTYVFENIDAYSKNLEVLFPWNYNILQTFQIK